MISLSYRSTVHMQNYKHQSLKQKSVWLMSSFAEKLDKTVPPDPQVSIPYNRPYWHSRYWTGTSLQWRLMRGNIIEKRLMSFAFKILPTLASHASYFHSNTRKANSTIFHLNAVLTGPDPLSLHPWKCTHPWKTSVTFLLN